MRVREKLSGLKAVCYGPFAPAAAGEGCVYAARLRRDVEVLRELGANAVRLYEVPSAEALELLAAAGLGAVVTLPWSQHVCFLEDGRIRRQVEGEIERAIEALPVHRALRCVLVGNEIPADVVRWHGERRVSRFLDGVIRKVRSKFRDVPLGYASFPTTEGLLPDEADFLAYNIFLDREEDWQRYLDHLAGLGHERPLVVTELGCDAGGAGDPGGAAVAGGAGEAGQADFFRRVLPVVEDAAVMGVCVFSFTDEWWRGGEAVRGWRFGLTRVDRSRRAAFGVVRDFWAAEGERFEGMRPFCVAVCARNAARTLPMCLDSLARLHPAPQEVVVVDDGSVDGTAQIAQQWAQGRPQARVVRMEAAGLSAARNRALAECRAEFIAYTDADCEVPERWLEYLWRAFAQNPKAAAAGGPNFAPRDECPKTAALNAAPGTACHVLLEGRRAEHLPGCNMAFRVGLLRAAGDFDRQFHAAGDDVDVCWRLCDSGLELAFHPAAWVWHLRRGSLGAFWRQQRGYGAAEAALRLKHAARFSAGGGARWQGVIYPWWTRRRQAEAGVFGTAGYQSVYPAGWSRVDAALLGGRCAVGVVLLFLLGVAGVGWGFVLGAILSGAAAMRAVLLARQVPLHTQSRLVSRLWLVVIFLTQKSARDFGRWQAWRRLTGKSLLAGWRSSSARKGGTGKVSLVTSGDQVWSEKGLERLGLLHFVWEKLVEEGWCVDAPHPVREYDLRVWMGANFYAKIRCVTEWHGKNRTLSRLRWDCGWLWGALAWKYVEVGVFCLLLVVYFGSAAAGVAFFLAVVVLEAGVFLWIKKFLKKFLRRLIRERSQENF